VTTLPDGSITAPPEVNGCASTVKLYKTPDDMTAPGPWPVGVKTVQLMLDGVMANVEVWYPAPLGSNAGVSEATWDLRNWLPSGMGSMIPDSANRIVTCDGSNNSAPCYRDLPLDSSHGPYPAVIFIHGTGSFRLSSGSAMSEWASRGFIAVAADHPGMFLTDYLASGSCAGGGTGTTQPAGSLNAQDIVDEINALTNNSSGPFAFLGNSVDMTRIGVSGHSQGASGAASAASQPNVQVDMPLADAGGTVPSGSALKSALFMGGMNDSVVAYSSDTSAYAGTTASIKRVIGITGGNHLDVTDLCTQTNSTGQTGIQIADMYNVCGDNSALVLLNSLAQCGNVMPVAAGPEIVNYATSAALEETLHCVDRSAAFSMLQSTFPQVGDFQHTP
jgi:platelet-activating factor acetylhydrolase isoform II